MTLRIRRITLDDTPQLVAPTSIDRVQGSGVRLSVLTPGGVCRIHSQDDHSHFIEFTDDDAFPPIDGLTGDDEVWVSAASGSIEVEVLEQGVA